MKTKTHVILCKKLNRNEFLNGNRYHYENREHYKNVNVHVNICGTE